MKQIFLILVVFAAASCIPRAYAQSIGPSTLNATGGSNTIGGNICDWSIGEMTMVSTFSGSSNILTQGVLQNEIMINEGIGNTTLAERIQVFPNPASSMINLRFNAVTDGALGYRLMDMAGRIVTVNNADVKQGILTEQINVSNLADAVYTLEVYFTAANNATQQTTYKIEKTK
jgi:hypothetical protein